MSGRLVYAARLLRVQTAKGVRQTLAFTALRNCPDYAGRLPLDEAARMILGAAGRRGTCRDYFENTLRHLEQLGFADRPLRRLPSGSRHWPNVPEFETLIAARKACRICVERSPGKIRSCAEFDFDPDVVSHWEQWLGHRSPKLLVVGQDFGNVGYFVRCRGRDEPDNKTNENLYRLLTAAGLAVGHPSQRDDSAPVFLTNSILCIKEGAMNSPIRSSWVDACSEQHLLPLISFSGRRSSSGWAMPDGAPFGSSSRCMTRRGRFRTQPAPIGLPRTIPGCLRSAIAVHSGSSTGRGRSSSRIGGGSARPFPFALPPVRRYARRK